MWLLVLAGLPAFFGLQVPSGWTPVGPDRALLNPSDPSRGEIWELPVAGARCTPEDLLSVLRGFGYSPSVLGPNGEGVWSVAMGNGLVATVRSSLGTDRTTWHLVMASEESSRALDARALLAMMGTPVPSNIAGLGPVEVLGAGTDGPRWGFDAAATEPTRGEQTPWSAAPTLPLKAELFGLWEGEAEFQGQPANIRLRLEATGRVVWERNSSFGRYVMEGTWSAQDQILCIKGFSGDELRSIYSIARGELILRIDNRQVNLSHR